MSVSVYLSQELSHWRCSSTVHAFPPHAQQTLRHWEEVLDIVGELHRRCISLVSHGGGGDRLRAFAFPVKYKPTFLTGAP